MVEGSYLAWKIYYIFHRYEPLQQWEVESLEEAFISEPEMAVYIAGMSQMNWGQPATTLECRFPAMVKQPKAPTLRDHHGRGHRFE